jgi:hypothetical protein
LFPRVRPSLLLAAALALACRGDGDRTLPGQGGAGAPAAFDWSRPAAALAMTADEAAARLGSFETEAAVRWTVDRGPASRPVAASERHRVRQLAGGEFEAESQIDPGGGPGTETGRTVIFTGGTTWARSRFAPFRERPTDRGRDARRFRDESFRLAGDLATLYGPALQLRPGADGSALGRPAKRFLFALDRAAAAPARPAPPPGRSDDPDTKARLELLEGATPLAADGELVLDAATGAPLAVRLRGAFAAAADPQLRVEVDLDARVAALGSLVGAVRPPPGARPDERKPNGPARALEAAGLRERGKPPAAGERAVPEEPAE